MVSDRDKIAGSALSSRASVHVKAPSRGHRQGDTDKGTPSRGHRNHHDLFVFLAYCFLVVLVSFVSQGAFVVSLRPFVVHAFTFLAT